MFPLTRFCEFIELNELFGLADKILLAVSAGKDSVLMAHLFNEAKFNFGIAHCNFNLRGDESNGDEEFSRVLADQLNVEFHTIAFDTESFSKSNKVSIQMAARQLRYDWFEKIRKEYGYDYIALAQHQNDAVETVLLNLVRGTGIAGLHGILPKRNRLIRPLLFLDSDEINMLVSENNLAYREDGSNASVKYARNKIRLEVIPKLKELNPLLEETFGNNSRRFKEIEDFLNLEVERLRTELFKSSEGADIRIPLESLKELKPLALLLYELFKPYHFAEAVLADLVKSWNGQSGKVFQSATHTLFLDRNILILSRVHTTATKEILISKTEKTLTFEHLHLQVDEVEAAGFNIIKDKNLAFFDESLLQFPLKLRLWKKGDYFYPFGMKGRKKLSDFFVGIKMPLSEKRGVPVLENGNGDIVWVIGFRSDERYKITSQTKKIIIFEKQKK